MSQVDLPVPEAGRAEPKGETPSPAREPRSTSGRPRRRRSVRESGWRSVLHNPYFEPVITVVAIVVLLGALFAYTDNWPPLVVVESSSMQHGTNDIVGLINTGDLVLVERIGVPQSVNTYVTSESTGYATYGEFGDVLLYFPNGNSAETPVIHRAILWLNWVPSADSFSAPSLSDLLCGPHAQYQVIPPGGSPQTAPCPTNLNAPLVGTINLYGVGWQSANVSISLSALAQESPHSGFVTMGDNNFIPATSKSPAQGTFDQDDGCIIACLVAPTWVEGVARGMIPWFGAIKLLLSGNSGYVPSQTWEYLGLTILVILAAPSLLPPLIRRLRHGDGPRSQEPEEPGGELPASPPSPEGPLSPPPAPTFPGIDQVE